MERERERESWCFRLRRSGKRRQPRTLSVAKAEALEQVQIGAAPDKQNARTAIDAAFRDLCTVGDAQTACCSEAQGRGARLRLFSAFTSTDASSRRTGARARSSVLRRRAKEMNGKRRAAKVKMRVTGSGTRREQIKQVAR
eukprot:4797928-Pleurochrysis_carterae.AAC.2